MKLKKLLTTGAVVFATLAASPSVFAHASFSISGTAQSPVWLNGVPAIGVEFPNPGPVPTSGFTGIHGATASNNRIIETGVFNTAASNAQLGGSWHGVATSYKNTLLGQLANFDATAATPLPYNGGVMASQAGSQGYNEAVAVAQGSGLSSFYNAGTNTYNSGDFVINPYAGSGSTATNPDGEQNIIYTTGAQYLNVSIATDNLAVTGTSTPGVNTGTNELTYSIYQGLATGPGLQGLVLLGTGTASAPGQELDFSIALQGAYLNGLASGGEFTLVVGDVSQSTNPNAANYIAAGSYDQYIKIAEWETGTAPSGVVSANSAAGLMTNSNMIYQEQGTLPTAATAPVPVPGAVWLFGTALAGFVGFGRRKQVTA
jgi:hypothetical protein